MTPSRLEQLQKFLEDDPRDTFTHYAIAIEYVKMKAYPEAIAKFEEVIRLDPAYVPAYHQLGRVLLFLGKHSEARMVLEEGIRIAHELGDTHAGVEMEDALAGLS